MSPLPQPPQPPQPQRVPTAFTLGHADGLSVDVLDYGATLTAIRLPSAQGPITVSLCYPQPADYLDDRYFLGSTVGPYANRLRVAEPGGSIADGYSVVLHGGENGFHSRYWEAAAPAANDRLDLRLESDVGDSKATVVAQVRYRIRGSDTLDIEFSATVTEPVPLSLTNHAYFNLAGQGLIDRHRLTVFADEITEVDAALVPTGDLIDVVGTNFDFRTTRQLDDPPVAIDRNYVLSGAPSAMRPAARLEAESTRLGLEVSTTQPGLQVYTGDNLSKPFAPRAGVCLEAQNFPDAPNQPGFPKATYGPGDEYAERIRYRFQAL